MCGIAGYALSTLRDQNISLSAMVGVIAHRGPDDEGFHEAITHDRAFRVGLAHRRLSIIDLATGHQPIGNEDNQIQVVFNGEIYNFLELRTQLIQRGHHFATSSDTEIIVHAYEEYGEACVEMFRGMFAFALWDANSEKLFLARDQFGKKPLFIYESKDGIFFGSEIKTILTHPGLKVEVNYDALWNYLVYRYVPGPATFIRGIQKLPPGSFAVWQKGKFTVHRYYTPPDHNTCSGHEVDRNPTARFLEQLDEAVRIRMVSDVPFGAFLSGGIDSSAVVALMARHSNMPINTFSVGFQEESYSELIFARDVAQALNTCHHELEISASNLLDYLPVVTRARDAPVSEPSDIPIFLLSREARNTVKMVLTGEGSDEILGGYPKHIVERYAWLYQVLPAMLRNGLLAPMVDLLPYSFRKTKIAVRALSIDDLNDRFPCWFGGLSPAGRAGLVNFRPGCGNMYPTDPFNTEYGNSALRRLLYFDQTSWLPDNLLERGDRMTMAASLEARMPFMDTKLAAYISSLPDKFRVRGLQTKWILRAAMKNVLPERILKRPKVGFRVPVNEWFRGPMRDYLFDHLLGNDSKTRGYYQRDKLNAMLNEHMTGRHNHEKALWTLLTFEIWHRLYV